MVLSVRNEILQPLATFQTPAFHSECMLLLMSHSTDWTCTANSQSFLRCATPLSCEALPVKTCNPSMTSFQVASAPQRRDSQALNRPRGWKRML